MLLSIAESLLKENEQQWKTVVPNIFASSSHFHKNFVYLDNSCKILIPDCINYRAYSINDGHAE